MIGAQQPRLIVEPKRAATDGQDAVLLMKAYGNELFEWQERIVDCWLSRDEEGELAVTTAGLSVPRQNGKNVCLEAREFYGLTILGERILHTAHQVRTSKKSFRRLAAMFQDKRHPEVMAMVKKIRWTNGEECIELKNGGSIEFSSRSRQSARGIEGISLVVFDEAQELTDDQIESIIATLAASSTGTRQIIYTGTPPYPNCPGEVFKRIRKRMIENPGAHDAWSEWSPDAETIEDIDVTSKEIWYMTNPSMGLILTEEYTEEEFRTQTRAGFARERLGWWMPSASGRYDLAINEEAWKACRSKKKKPEGKIAYGVKFSPDNELVCLCGAVIPKEGPARITLIDMRMTITGLQWLADWLNQRSGTASCVVIDGKAGAYILIEKLAGSWKAKNSVIKASTNDVIASTGMLVNSINELGLTWYYEQEALNESATTSTKRMIGRSGDWGFGGENALPIQAAALAYWGAKTSKRDPSKEMRIG